MSSRQPTLPLDRNDSIEEDLVQIARVALASGNVGASRLLRQMARKYREQRPRLAATLVGLLRESPLRGIASTPQSLTAPLDTDSRLPLVRQEQPVVLPTPPILPPDTRRSLQQLVDERLNASQLTKAGLAPTRTALLVGPPGVGKTLAARWIAWSLDLPLLILDLATVMSSYLGRTGVNVKRVLDHARTTNAVLLVDEIDAIAKRRDDSTDIGELKRLVTVLLQEIDAWPEGSLLLAATNHPDLLDPAVWRRFEVVIDLPLPDTASLISAITQYTEHQDLRPQVVAALAEAYRGTSFSEVEHDVMRARRQSALTQQPLETVMLPMAKGRFRAIPAADRGKVAAALVFDAGLSQRQVHELTGVSRDTLRKYVGRSTAES